MGFVFRAEDDGLQRPVALKVMRPEIAAEATARERFLREGRSAAAIDSDHVITIYQVGEANGVPFLAMKYLDGQNLDEWLNTWQKTKNRPVSATAVVRVAKDVLKGLVAAHEKGLIHRDIKPANLWVEAGTSRVKLLDFGLTRGSESDKGLTRSGQVLGTPSYMAPEQARGLRLDARADLFSVGIVLYRMISGRNPFQRESVFATLTALAVDEPPQVASFGVVPEDLAALVDRMLAKSPDGRPATAKAALAVVLEVEQQLRSGRPASSGVVPVPVAPIRSPEVRPETVPERKVIEEEPAPPVEPASEITTRPITTPPVPRVPSPPPSPERVWPSPTPRSWSSARPLPEEGEPKVTPKKMARPGPAKVKYHGPARGEDEPDDTPRKLKKRKTTGLWYGVIATGIIAILVIVGVVMIVAKMRPDRGRPTSGYDGPDTASTKRGGDTAPPSKGSGELAPPLKGSGGVTPPVTKVTPEGEADKAFDYVIEGVTKKGTRWVVTLDIGGGETMEFVRLPKGTFLMGAPGGEPEALAEEKPQRRVEISQDFYLGKYEVTQAQYKAVTGADPSNFKGGRLPVEGVSWNDATGFCSTLSGRVKRKVELPTEAEWEYACRAGTTTPFHFGSKLNGDLANCDGNSPYGTEVKGADKETTVEVGSYPANPWGLHDMHGNVWEWCQDYYGPYDKIANLKDPFQSTKQFYASRVLRGGSCRYFARHCRSASRHGVTPDYRLHNGFRVCFHLD
jgi:formylglycine-generating enzyme required for sulfatase activity/serine/threonine protein kinase